MAQDPFNTAAENKNSNSWMETAWQKFTPFELGMWVHLFTKSGTLRQQGAAPEKKDIEKSVKDLHMARHYFDMLTRNLDALGLAAATDEKPMPATGATPHDDIARMAHILAANAEIVKDQPAGSTRHSVASSSIHTTLRAIEDKLEQAENNARPEVRAALDKTSHWKKNNGVKKPGL